MTRDRIAFIQSELERISPWSNQAIVYREELMSLRLKREVHDDREDDPKEEGRPAAAEPQEDQPVHR